MALGLEVVGASLNPISDDSGTETSLRGAAAGLARDARPVDQHQ
ncbi:hypothetical protein [Aeromicrobium sp. Root472D3]|nr:hypothetical protein [Aeromicrobium sp. Root472D3]